jgi:hypothetical protein
MAVLDTLSSIKSGLGECMSWFQSIRGKRKPANSFKQLHERVKPQVPDYKDAPHYHGNLDKALEYFADSLGVSDDYMVRVVEVSGHSAAVLFIDTICDHKAVEETLRELHQHRFPKKKVKNLMQYLIERVLPGSDAVYMTNMFELKEAITAGDLVLLIDEMSPAIVTGAKYVEHRQPDQPFVESTVRGSQISFVENLDVNVGLLRTYLNTDSFHIKKLKVGYRSRKEVAVAYIGDIANPLLVKTVIQRISAIHIDVITQGSAIEHRITGHTWTPFPLTRALQRIDSAAHEINQGKVAIIVDGDPTILLVPATVQDFFQTEEDFSHSFYEGTLIRWLRVISFIFAVYLPSFYIAFVDFNPELLPKVLGLQIAKSREGVPFPAVMEVLIMQIVIEILREATLRMPKQMGQTIGIVGGLVVGEASVQAGLVSNILIIVVALTAVSIFVSPSYEFATVLRIGNFIMILSATLLGLYGIILASIWSLYEMSALKSFGISYLDPFNGEHIRNVFTDAFLRLPVKFMDKRTSHLHPQDETGESEYVNPVPHPHLEKSGKKRIRAKGRR